MEIVARQRALIGVHRPNVFTGPVDTLVDVLVHSLDIAVPLGLDIPLPVDGAAAALDGIVACRGTRKGQVFREQPIRYRLVATDTEWAWGEGPDVRLPVRDLLLIVSGRRPVDY